ncbi:MAG: hypothetical protein HYX86_01055 [Chloroflexi bacterium]|nr:hypothetical protein [Chloroflexota bacterium]
MISNYRRLSILPLLAVVAIALVVAACTPAPPPPPVPTTPPVVEEPTTPPEVEIPTRVGLRAVDDFTLEITLTSPQAFFDSILAFFTTYPTRLDVINQFGDDWVLPGNLVGNGPYVLSEHEPQDHVTLTANPNWWGAPFTIQTFTQPVITESSTMLAAYENNELDVSGFPSAELPRILEDPVLSQEFHILPRPGVYYVGFNTNRAPTDNFHFRAALASSIDRRNILDNVLNNPWREAAQGVIAPGIPGYQGTDTGFAFDPAAAQAHLQLYIDDTGQTCTADSPCSFVVDLWFNQGNEDVLEAVAAGWTENLILTDADGNEIAAVHATTVRMEWAVYLETLDQCNATPDDTALCDYNAYRLGWVMDYGDANNIVNEVFAPGSPFQYTGYESAEVSGLIDQALTERDPAARAALWTQAEDLIVTDLAITAPIFFYDRQGLIKPWLDFEFPPFGAAFIHEWGFVEGVAVPVGVPEGMGVDTIRSGSTAEPPTLDQALATDTTSHAIINNLFAGLYKYEPDGSITPYGALSYEVSEDGTVYTVHLNPDAVWSDGTPVIAQHYVDGICRMLNPETAAEYAYVMYYILGAPEFNSGEAVECG